jgi:hypothetical protein
MRLMSRVQALPVVEKSVGEHTLDYSILVAPHFSRSPPR